jgi:hypothetical protein
VNLHKIKIRSTDESGFNTGFNTEVSIDGTPIKGVTALYFEVLPGQVARLSLELMADVEVDHKGRIQKNRNTKSTSLDVIDCDGVKVGKLEIP